MISQLDFSLFDEISTIVIFHRYVFDSLLKNEIIDEFNNLLIVSKDNRRFCKNDLFYLHFD